MVGADTDAAMVTETRKPEALATPGLSYHSPENWNPHDIHLCSVLRKHRRVCLMNKMITPKQLELTAGNTRAELLQDTAPHIDSESPAFEADMGKAEKMQRQEV